MANESIKPSRKLFVAHKGHKKYAKSTLQKIWKDSERQLGMWLKEHDVPDKFFEKAETSCGRIGYLTGLQMDVISKNFVGENKSREDCPKWLSEAFLLLLQKSDEWRRPGILRMDFYGELEKNALGLERLPDLILITVEDFGNILDELRRLRKANKEGIVD